MVLFFGVDPASCIQDLSIVLGIKRPLHMLNFEFSRETMTKHDVLVSHAENACAAIVLHD